MNDHEAQRIAAAMHQLRPDWPAASLLTLIRKNLIDRPRRDVTVALAWVACETNTHTPARVLEAGPWWQAEGYEGTTARRHHQACDVCQICNHPPADCARIWSGEHEFQSRDQIRKARDKATDAGSHVALVREQVQHVKHAAAETPKLAPATHSPDCIRAADHTGPCLPPVTEEPAVTDPTNPHTHATGACSDESEREAVR